MAVKLHIQNTPRINTEKYCDAFKFTCTYPLLKSYYINKHFKELYLLLLVVHLD